MSTKAYITESHYKRSKMAESLRESSIQSAFALDAKTSFVAQAAKATSLQACQPKPCWRRLVGPPGLEPGTSGL